jgi:hypothetical protein
MKERGQALEAVTGLLSGGPGDAVRFPVHPRAEVVLVKKGIEVHAYAFGAERSVAEGCPAFLHDRLVARVGDPGVSLEGVMDLDAVEAEKGGEEG